MRIERFEDIESWQLARELTKTVYAETRRRRDAEGRNCYRRAVDLGVSALVLRRVSRML